MVQTTYIGEMETTKLSSTCLLNHQQGLLTGEQKEGRSPKRERELRCGKEYCNKDGLVDKMGLRWPSFAHIGPDENWKLGEDHRKNKKNMEIWDVDGEDCVRGYAMK